MSDLAEALYAQVRARSGSVWNGKLVNGYSDMVSYYYAAGAYPDLMIAAINCATNLGVTNANNALTVMQNLPTKPGWATDYRFHNKVITQ